jgi:hypothetical protein
MYFGGRLCPSDPGLRPSDVGLRSGIPRKSLQSSWIWWLDSAVEQRRFSVALPEEFSVRSDPQPRISTDQIVNLVLHYLIRANP